MWFQLSETQVQIVAIVLIILCGSACFGLWSLVDAMESVDEKPRTVTKWERMQQAKDEYEADLQVIAQFPDPLVRQAAANAASMKLRRTLEALLKE
jgi:hypothetical protein